MAVLLRKPGRDHLELALVLVVMHRDQHKIQGYRCGDLPADSVVGRRLILGPNYTLSDWRLPGEGSGARRLVGSLPRRREVDVRMPLPRLGGVIAICGGGLTIASTYLVAWGFWVDPLEVPTRGSDTLAQLSEHMGGWLGMATAVMTTGGALLVVVGLLSILLPRSRLVCGISLSLGSLTVLFATIESLGLPTELSRGSALLLCLLGATLGGLGAAAAFIPRVDGPHEASSEMAAAVSANAAN